MKISIEEIASKFTKEDFLNNIKENSGCLVIDDSRYGCPSYIGLDEPLHCSHINSCIDCWAKVIENIQFKESNSYSFDEYEEAAKRTMKDDCSMEKALIEGALGLSGEAGEVIDLIKKFEFQGHGLSEEDIINELGDVLWYITRIATALNVKLKYIPISNIDKLNKRYPNGFKAENSINREENCITDIKTEDDFIINSSKEDMFKQIVTQMLDIYIAKNKDYGDSFSKLRNELGDKTILVRIGDKYNRLLSLLSKDTQLVKDESIDDTLIDLANYCIMELIERKLER